MAERRPVTPLLDWLVCVAAAFPFALSSLLFAFGPAAFRGEAVLALTTYSAIVLSFIGGHRWGLEVASRGNAFLMFAATLPALAGWAVIVLPPSLVSGATTLGALLIVVVATWVWDVASAAIPAWYKPLRTFMATIAAASLGLALWKATQLGL